MKIGQQHVKLAVLSFVLFTVAFCAWKIHYQWKWAVADYKKQLLSSGEKLDIGDLIPIHASPDQNSAGTCLKAISLLRGLRSFLDTNAPPAMRMVAPGRAMIGWRSRMFAVRTQQIRGKPQRKLLPRIPKHWNSFTR